MGIGETLRRERFQAPLDEGILGVASASRTGVAFFLSFTPTSNLTSFGAALTDIVFDFSIDGGDKRESDKREREDREEREDESDLDVPLKYSQH